MPDSKKSEEMPNSAAPVIVQVEVRISVRVTDLVRIRVWMGV